MNGTFSREKGKATFVGIVLYTDMALGLRYISSVLKKEHHACYLIFFRADASPETDLKLFMPSEAEIENLAGLVKQLRPDIIGINVTSTYSKIALRISASLKRSIGVPIIWGGPHPTVEPEGSLQWADMVCMGEGEEPVRQMAKNIVEGKRLDSIAGIWSKNDNGTITKNDCGPLIQDLDTLPFPDYEWKDKYYIEDGGAVVQKRPDAFLTDGDYFLISSRGCPFSCAYCDNNNLKRIYSGEKYLRRRSVENVIGEMKAARRDLPVSNFVLTDDVFLFDEEWIGRFVTAYTADIHMPFYCRTHPQFVNEKMVAEIKEAGAHTIGMGIESGSRRMLRLYRRPHSPEQIVQAVRILHTMRYYSVYDIIVNDPLATKEDQKETLDLLLTLPKPFFPKTFSLAHFPKTELTERSLSEKVISKEDVEGLHEKFNWRVTAEGFVKKENRLLNCLIELTGNIFIPNFLLRILAKSRFLEENPGRLAAIVYSKKSERIRRRIFEITSLSLPEIGIKTVRRIFRMLNKLTLRKR